LFALILHSLKPSEIHLSTQTPAEDSENSEVEKAIQKVSFEKSAVNKCHKFG
jgi:hypothetical protein